MRRLPLAVSAVGLLALVLAPPGVQATLIYNQVVLLDNPVAYYRMNETSGTTAIDSVAAQNGTYVGGVTVGNAGPPYSGFSGGNTAVTLNGSTGYLDTGSAITTLSTANYSYEVWFNAVANDGNSRYIAGRYLNAVSFVGDSLFENGDSLRYFDGTTAVSGPAYTPSAWHQAVLTRSGTTVKVYLDGVLGITQTAANDPFGSSNEFVAGRRPDNVFYFKTGLDELSVYNATLTPQQVMDHYLAAFAVPEPSTVLLFGVGGLLVWRRRARK